MHGLQLLLLLLLLLAAAVVKGYHSPLTENENVHCWPLGANEQNDEVIDCKGIIYERYRSCVNGCSSVIARPKQQPSMFNGSVYNYSYISLGDKRRTSSVIVGTSY